MYARRAARRGRMTAAPRKSRVRSSRTNVCRPKRDVSKINNVHSALNVRLQCRFSCFAPRRLYRAARPAAQQHGNRTKDCVKRVVFSRLQFGRWKRAGENRLSAVPGPCVGFCAVCFSTDKNDRKRAPGPFSRAQQIRIANRCAAVLLCDSA